LVTKDGLITNDVEVHNDLEVEVDKIVTEICDLVAAKET
jgi:hypothetical protein